MIDFTEARAKMVNNQVRTCDVTQHALISAMLTVPREEFVSEEQKPLAYIDEDISLSGIGAEGRFLTEPAQFAKLAQLCSVNTDDVVLVLGAGCGYAAAVFSQLCSSVVALEENDKLCQHAEVRLSELGFDNVAVVQGPLEDGWANEAPYDVIFIDGAVGFVPESIINQLQSGGRLVSVQGTGNSAVARIYTNDDSIISNRDVMNCAIPALPGFRTEAGFVF